MNFFSEREMLQQKTAGKIKKGLAVCVNNGEQVGEKDL